MTTTLQKRCVDRGDLWPSRVQRLDGVQLPSGVSRQTRWSRRAPEHV